MKVKTLKNFIYDGTFRKVGEIFNMKDEDAKSYESRHWVITGAKVPVKLANAPELPATLPPLTVDGKKKK